MQRFPTSTSRLKIYKMKLKLYSLTTAAKVVHGTVASIISQLAAEALQQADR